MKKGAWKPPFIQKVLNSGRKVQTARGRAYRSKYK